MNVFIAIMNIVIPSYEYYNWANEYSWTIFTLQYLAVEMEMGIILAVGDAFRIDTAPCAVTQF